MYSQIVHFEMEASQLMHTSSHIHLLALAFKSPPPCRYGCPLVWSSGIPPLLTRAWKIPYFSVSKGNKISFIIAFLPFCLVKWKMDSLMQCCIAFIFSHWLLVTKAFWVTIWQISFQVLDTCLYQTQMFFYCTIIILIIIIIVSFTIINAVLWTMTEP